MNLFVYSANTNNKNNAYFSRSLQHVSTDFYGHNRSIFYINHKVHQVQVSTLQAVNTIIIIKIIIPNSGKLFLFF
jgi:hypothetical protein